MKVKEQLKTQEIIERLAAKYPSPMYGFITQVRNGTGYSASRTADAIAMSLWPSRGLHLMGFEVKASRSDWMHEYKNPSKADDIANYCHYWYLVVGDEDIVKDDELPKTWGLIVPNGKGLKIKKEATHNPKPWPIDNMFMAGIFRNIAEQCTANEVIESKLDAREKKGREWAKSDIDDLNKKIKEIQDALNIFEKHSGVSLLGEKDLTNRYSYLSKDEFKDIGNAVKVVLAGKDIEGQKRLERLLDRSRNLVKFLEGENISSWDS